MTMSPKNEAKDGGMEREKKTRFFDDIIQQEIQTPVSCLLIT